MEAEPPGGGVALPPRLRRSSHDVNYLEELVPAVTAREYRVEEV